MPFARESLHCFPCASMLINRFVRNVPSKSLLGVRGMEGRVSSNLKGGAYVRLTARI